MSLNLSANDTLGLRFIILIMTLDDLCQIGVNEPMDAQVKYILKNVATQLVRSVLNRNILLFLF